MDDIPDPLAPKLPDFARGMRILLVDGDTSSLMYMASMLEAYSYKVTTIELPAIAMPVYVERRHLFDSVIVNVHLDKAAEVEFVEELLNKDWTPIIVMSTVGVSVLREQPAFARACHFLKKPVSGCQLRGVWQHIYKDRLAKRGFLQEIIADGNGNDPMQIDGNEAERVQMEGVNGNERVQTEGQTDNERVQTEGVNKNERVQTEGVNETERVQTRMNETERVLMEGVKETDPVQIEGNETERLQTEGMLVTGKGVGIEIGEGENGYGIPQQDEVQAGDPEGKNEQVEGAAGTDEQLKTTEANKNKRTGGRKRAKDGDNNGDRKRYRRRNTSSSSKAWNKKRNGNFEVRQNIRWTRELHFKFTAAISKLGEAMATPTAIRQTMNVPGLGLNQIAQELEKYKAQVQIIMAACELTPREIPPHEPPAITMPAVNDITRVPPPQKQQSGLVGTGTNQPVQTFPPLSRQPGLMLDQLQALKDGIAPGYFGANGQGQGSHQGIQIRERPSLPPHPTPLQTNDKGKGKDAMEFQGDVSPPYAPSLSFWQNPSPSLNFNGLFEETLMGGASSSANPPSNSNPPDALGNIGASTSANQNVPGNPAAGQGGLDEGTDDLSWLSEWLGKSLTNDDIDPFDWLL